MTAEPPEFAARADRPYGVRALGLCALLLVPLLAPGLLPGRVLLPYDPRLHAPFCELLPPEQAAALLADSAGLFGDHLLQCLPFERFTAAQLREGRLPLWNPALLGGVPHAAQGTGQVFYPPAWLLGCVDPLVLAPLLFAGHLLLGAWFLLRWFGLLGVDRRAGLAAALIWTLSGWAWTNLHHQPIVQAGSWVFLGLWALERLARPPASLGAAAGLAAAAALALLAGFPQVGLLVLGLLTAHAGLLSVLAGRAGGVRGLAGFAFPAFGALAAGAALAAPQLLALAEEARLGGRGPLSLEVMAAHALSPAHLLGLFFPELLAPLRGNPYASLGEMHPTYALLALDRRPPGVLGALNAKETWLYLGLFPLLLTLAALPLWKKPRVALLLAVLLAGLLAALGLTPFLELWALVGARAGDPKRLLFLTAVAGVCLAGFGLDRWLGRERPGRLLGRVGLVFALAGGLALGGALLLPERVFLRLWLERVAILFADQIAPLAGDRPWWQVAHEEILRLFPGEPAFNVRLTQRVLARFGLAALAAGLPLWLASRGPARLRWPLLAAGLALALGDLGYTAWRMARPVAAAGVDLASAWERLLPDDPGPGGEPGAPGRLLRLESTRRTTRPELLIPNLPALLGWEDAQGYVPLIPGRLRELFAALDPELDLGGAGVHSLARPDQLEAPFLRLLRPSRLLADVDVDPAQWRPAGRTPSGVRLYAAEGLLPFGFTVPIREVLPREQLLARLVRPGLDPRERVLLEGTPSIFAPPDGICAPARLLERAPGRLLLEARGPGTLVLCEGYHPGWRAWVDGRPTATLPADHAFLGLPLDQAGSQRVEFRFRPASLEQGLWAAAGGTGGVLLLLAWAAARRWRGR